MPGRPPVRTDAEAAERETRPSGEAHWASRSAEAKRVEPCDSRDATMNEAVAPLKPDPYLIHHWRSEEVMLRVGAD